MRCFEGAPFKFRAPFGARTFSPLWTDLLQSFTPSVACIPAGKRRSTRRKIFAKSLAQSCLVLSDKLVCFNQKLYGLAAKWFPGVLPLRHGALIHHSRSFSVPRSLYGAAQRLERIFCVLLRLSERSGHRLRFERAPSHLR